MNKMIVCLSLASMAAVAFADIPEGYEDFEEFDLSSGALTAADGGRYCVTGSGNVVTVPDGVSCDILFNGVTIATPSDVSPLTIGAGAAVRLFLEGTSTLTGASGWAGVQMGAGGASLTVAGGAGTLSATGGDSRPGIMVLDGASFVMAEGASNVTVKATGGAKKTVGGVNCSAAGVGSYAQYDSGSVTIWAGRLEATGGAQAAGIGAGTSDQSKSAGTCGDVAVHGGVVVATAMKNGWGCGIGGGVPYLGHGGHLKSYLQTGGDVKAYGKNSPGLGAASGGMKAGGATDNHGGDVLGEIRVTGGELIASNVVDATTGIVCPALGGGGIRDVSGTYTASSSGGTILIEGGRVLATGPQIGIGSGGYASVAPQALHSKPTQVIVSGGEIIAKGGMWGIGGAEQATSAATNLTSVTITGGTLHTSSGVQVQPTNGEALGNRRLYETKVYPSDLSPYYVQAGEGGPAYEHVFTAAYNATWHPDNWAHLWLPVGTHRLLDATSSEMFVDVSTPEQPTFYDVGKTGIQRFTNQSRNAIVTGSWNYTDDSFTNRYFAVMPVNGESTVTISNLTATTFRRLFHVQATRLNLVLKGVNVLTATCKDQNIDNAPVTVRADATLRISGDGELRANGADYAAGIGQSGTADCGAIIIDSGTVIACGGSQGAGIGCAKGNTGAGRCGDVTVNGGVVRAYGFRLSDSGGRISGSGWAAGIGGGTGYNTGGGGLKSYTQTGGDVEAYGETAAGIGGGGTGPTLSTAEAIRALKGGCCGPVKITGGRLVADSVTYSVCGDGCTGAGIGGAGGRWNDSLGAVGQAGSLASYEQTGGDVTVRGKMIGIGGGGLANGHDPSGFLPATTTVKVTGGTLTVSGAVYAIGGQETPDTPTTNLTSIVITGGSVKETGGFQIAPENANGTPVFAAPLSKRFIDPGATSFDLSFPVADTVPYTYVYAGAGHAADHRLHFWLPDGKYAIGKSGGVMENGRWYPYGGLSIYIR